MIKNPNLPQHLKLPFKVSHKLPFKTVQEEKLEKRQAKDIEVLKQKHMLWLHAIKRLARDNINNDFESLRISWTNRYKTPKYPTFEEYTIEEIILESWEQFYYENPENLELRGIFKKYNPNTKYAYYETGDPLIDALEKQFSEGEVPDLEAAFGHIKNGQDIFRSQVFRGPSGDLIAARHTPEVVKKNEKGEKINVAGAVVEHDDYKSDEWLKDALTEDPILKAMAEKLNKVNNAKI